MLVHHSVKDKIRVVCVVIIPLLPAMYSRKTPSNIPRDLVGPRSRSKTASAPGTSGNMHQIGTIRRPCYARFILEENRLAEIIMAPPIHSLVVMASPARK